MKTQFDTSNSLSEVPLPRLAHELKHSPLLEQLSDMAIEMVGMRIVVVYPGEKGLEQLIIGKSSYLNPFCKLIQTSHDGAEHCQMCHLVMTRSARPSDPMIRRCHMGSSALIRLISGQEDSSLAVLSSCSVIKENAESAWTITRRRGKEFGINETILKNAFRDMAHMSDDKLLLANRIMDMASAAVKLIVDKLLAVTEVERERKALAPGKEVTSVLEHELQYAGSSLKEHKRSGSRLKTAKRKGISPIDIVSEVVSSKPYLPYSLRTVAAACHITPNHFSFLFHQRHSLCFSDYLTEQRLLYSKQLLKDLTLNISQVASKSGFHDAGYFARRFKQKNGLSPREWRLKLERRVPS